MGGTKYFIIFINYHSRFEQLELFNEKSETLDIFKKFRVVIKLKLGKQIKCVHLDRSDEYYGQPSETGKNLGLFARYLQECEIKANYTMPNALEQNDITKHANRTLMRIIRCMMAHSSLLEFLQGKALKTTIYVLNQVPSRFLLKICMN